MSEDRHEAAEEQAEGRRDFLTMMAALGGAAVGSGILASAAEAAPPKRELKIRGNMPVLRNAQVQAFQGVFTKIGPNGYKLGAANPEAQEAMLLLPAVQRAAAVSALELGARPVEGEANSALAGRLGMFFEVLGAGLAAKANGGSLAPEKQVAQKDIEAFKGRSGLAANGLGCGSGCGAGCSSPVANGWGCGSGCGAGCSLNGAGLAASGFICGNNCSHPGALVMAVDQKGQQLKDVNFAELNVAELGQALDNAAVAHSQVFK